MAERAALREAPSAPRGTAQPGGEAPGAPANWRADRRLQRLEWTVLRRLDGLLQGDWRTLFRGHGLDLAELREYQHHDDVRRIDWHVTARLNHPYVREYLEDREATAWFLLDLSPSVDFGTRARKRSVATDLTGVLASALTRKGHRVGALLYGHGVDTQIAPRTGRRQVLELMHRIEQRPRPVAVTKAKAGGATKLDTLLHAARATIKGRSVVFVVSDFISQPGWEAPLAQLATRHDVVAARIVDPAERDIPNVGLVPLFDAETGEQMIVDTGAPGFRRRFAAAAARREAAVREALAGAGVDTLELSTDDDLAAGLLRFVHARRERARLSSGAIQWRAQRRTLASSSAASPHAAVRSAP